MWKVSASPRMEGSGRVSGLPRDTQWVTKRSQSRAPDTKFIPCYHTAPRLFATHWVFFFWQCWCLAWSCSLSLSMYFTMTDMYFVRWRGLVVKHVFLYGRLTGYGNWDELWPHHHTPQLGRVFDAVLSGLAAQKNQDMVCLWQRIKVKWYPI